jgi:hypothetical protein
VLDRAPEAFGQVLEERPPASDVERLRPPADGENGQLASDGEAGERELGDVEVGQVGPSSGCGVSP